MKTLHIVKIGGDIIDREHTLREFLSGFLKVEGPKILVHGGGKAASTLSERLGIQPRLVEGRRITDADTLKVITMVYAGLINKQLVAMLQNLGCASIGLSGADAALLPATRRSSAPVDYGFVGDIEPQDVNLPVLCSLIDAGLVPVICPVTYERGAGLLNTNADTVAAALAIALSACYTVNLNFCFGKKGILKDMEDENSVMEQLSEKEYLGFKKEGIVSKGMLPKLENAYRSLRNGVADVRIGQAADIELMIKKEKGAGTAITL
jgi:acetylglutamate kinase